MEEQVRECVRERARQCVRGSGRRSASKGDESSLYLRHTVVVRGNVLPVLSIICDRGQ
jgi:hypothetical protein